MVFPAINECRLIHFRNCNYVLLHHFHVYFRTMCSYVLHVTWTCTATTPSQDMCPSPFSGLPRYTRSVLHCHCLGRSVGGVFQNYISLHAIIVRTRKFINVRSKGCLCFLLIVGREVRNAQDALAACNTLLISSLN